ncbi:phospholipase A [Winogradskyella ursingii]|uniref:phospholipase A n=1 Tax=Winogradskyella ursingii TaxID=2686079 RepID=UPI0015C962F7|nr:phospholipase A [Winogradskyella ursingii]
MNEYKNNNLVFILIFSFLVLLLATTILNAQAYTKEEMKDSISKLPYFSIHKNNYFISGVPTNKSISRTTADAKYQISFKQILTRSKLPWDTYLFLTYTQKAFWNVYKESFPFSDINFNPSLALGKAFYDKNNRLKGIGRLSFEHESNGRDSIFSRTWNRISLEYATKIRKNTIANLKVWIPFLDQENNPDLLEFVGLGELSLSHIIKPNKWIADIRFRKGLNFEAKGSIRSRLYFNPFKNNVSNQYIMLEWFVGQAEGLLNYRQSKSTIRIGYVVRTNEFKWLKGKPN